MTTRIIPCLAALLALLLTLSRASAGYADSANVTVDTRTLTMTQLVVSGPTSVPWGQEAAYTATLNYQGAAAEDVTSQCEWFVTGGPTVTEANDLPYMNGNALNPKVVSIVPLLVSAKITRNNAKIASNTISVIVTEGTGMNIGMSWPSDAGPTYIQKSGTNFVWHYAANASGQALMKSGVTVVWFLDGVQVATGRAFSQNYTGMPGTKELKVVATDTEGRKGQATGRVTFNAPPVANEPALVQALDPKSGKLVDEDGNAFEFSPLKTPYGLIVVTHGLTMDSSDEPATDLWLRDMARHIRERLTTEGKRLPNIAVYKWFGISNPSGYWGIEDLRAKERQNWSWFLTGLPLAAVDFTVDFFVVKPHAQTQGQILAAWMWDEMKPGRNNIMTGAPMHLVGHSAGGFVVGECAWQLKNWFSNVRTTMLDTPWPVTRHLNDLPGPGRLVDKYVSSFFGAIENPLTLTAGLFGEAYYKRVVLACANPLAGDKIPTPTAHAYSRVWYDTNVRGNSVGTAGFGWSPFLSTSGGAAAPLYNDPMEPKGAPPLSPAPPLQNDIPITGFTTFGIVSAVTGGYQITEGKQANSGIVLANCAMPVGAQSISFRFQFTGAGDGDFLVASFGDNPPIGYGMDNNMSESEEVTVDMPVEHIAGQQGNLVFRLMSRGSQNAIATIKGITITEVDDPDMDGLSNVQEATYGTNPLLADSDRDGIADYDEINTTHTNPVKADTDADGSNDGSELAAGTNPLDGASRFAVRSSVKAGANFTITWSSVAAKHYRIIRSPEPGFGTYDVVVSGVIAAPPQQTYTDTGGVTGNRMFYRVELEP